MIRLRCKRCGAFLANVRSIYGPFRSVICIEINCRNRDCKLTNEIEFQIKKACTIKRKAITKRRPSRY